MTDRLIAFIMAIAVVLTLTSCGKEEAVPPDPPPKEENHVIVPEKEENEDSRPEKLPEPPEKGSIQADEAGQVFKIDSSYLENMSMTPEYIFPASDDILFVFASKKQENIVSENLQLFTYSIGRDRFTGDSMPVGVIGQYPNMIFDDGSVMLLTLNSETYELDTMLFIEPNTLAYEVLDLSRTDDIRSIVMTSDRKMTAVSTYTGMFITKTGTNEVLRRFDSFMEPESSAELDLHIPYATSWLPDNSAVLGNILGWEWVYYPFILAPDGEGRDLSRYEYLSAMTFGREKLLIYDAFTLIPAGVLNLSDDGYTEISISDIPSDEDAGYVSSLAASPDGEVLAAAVADPQGRASAIFSRGNEKFFSFDLEAEDEAPVSFENIDFSPDGKIAYMITSATVDSPREIYFTFLK